MHRTRTRLQAVIVPAIATLALGATLSAASSQRGREADPEKQFEVAKRRFDKNLDGVIDRSEFTRSRRIFQRLDENGDGVLTLVDFQLRAGAAPADLPPPDTASDSTPMTPEDLTFFETKVRPVLAMYCYSCHAEDASRIKGGLLVDSRAALLAGGASGAAIVPGHPDESPLIEAVRYDDPGFAMPPKQKLSDEAIRDLETWVRAGAPWPEEAKGSEPIDEVEDVAGGQSLDREIDIEAGRAFWSFQPVVKPVPPAVEGDWAWSEIDQFLQSAMTDVGVKPVPEADDRTWLRRVTFDLTGLPPSRRDIAAFGADGSDERFETVVDRLLASTAFGERFGRHWLDVARYGESSGKERNVVYPHAWRYRDWVIDAVNDDLPFDAFLKMQIAGDLLPADGPNEAAWNQIATGYLAIGSKSHGERDKRQFELDVADEQIDAVSQGMLGLTVSCARCHDHKFDPIPIEDYYSLAGIFMSSETMFGTQRTQGNNHGSDLIDLPRDAAVPNGPRMAASMRRILASSVDRAQSRIEKAMNAIDAPMMDAGDAPDDAMARDNERRAKRDIRRQTSRAELVDDLLSRFDERGNALATNRLAMGMADAKPRDIAVLERGEIDRPSGVAPRGMPQVLRAPDAAPIQSGSGRLELAEWIASEDNPLTARVWVNRVWQHMFGEGIVRTPDNFGAGGTRPDHPELLDWLTAEFIAGGWSTKTLVREMALSHTYRLDSKHHAGNARRDPEMITLWRMPERRLEAEAIRDAMLVASGTMSAERPIGSLTGTLEGQLRSEQVANLITREIPVRSVYLPSLRGQTVDSLDAFDAPDASFVSGKREVTTVATQALFLMNDADVLRWSDAFAKRLLAMDTTDQRRIHAAFEITLGRTPTHAERSAVTKFLKSYGRVEGKAETEPEMSKRDARRAKRRRERAGKLLPPQAEAHASPEHAAWSAVAQSLFQCAEFRSLG